MTTDKPTIGVMVIDDNTLIGDSMSRWLHQDMGMRLVGATGSTGEVETMVSSLRPDVILMDVDMPGCDTFALLRRLTTANPGLKVVMLSGHYREDYIERALDEGAMGYIVKDETPASIVEHIRKAASGEVVLSETARYGPR